MINQKLQEIILLNKIIVSKNKNELDVSNITDGKPSSVHRKSNEKVIKGQNNSKLRVISNDVRKTTSKLDKSKKK